MTLLGRSVLLPTLVAALLGLAGVPPGGSRAPTSRSCPRRWPRRSRSCSSARPATGGTNGLTNFRRFFGFNLYDPVNQQMLLLHRRRACCCVLVALARQLWRAATASCWSRCRDGEDRVRFLGYDPATSRPSPTWSPRAWRGWRGRCSCPIVGIISPPMLGIVPSIDFLIGVAIGGRTTLLGPVLGAIGVAWARPRRCRNVPVGLDLPPGAAVHRWWRSCRLAGLARAAGAAAWRSTVASRRRRPPPRALEGERRPRPRRRAQPEGDGCMTADDYLESAA